jgi:type II secretory pathway pseudopilin PulG
MPPRGFTLAEMVVSLGCVAVIAGATMSVMVVASRSMPRAGDRTDTATTVRQALDRIEAELLQAREVTVIGPAEFEVRVPDVTGDAADDSVLYRWPSKDGEPLVRVVNGGDDQVILEGVTGFTAEWTPRASVEAGAGPAAYGDEVVLASCSLPQTSTGRFKSGDKHAQWIVPVLPGGATHYQVTRFGAFINKAATGTVTFGADVVSGNVSGPTGTVLASSSLSATGSAGASVMSTAVFASPPERVAGQAVWVVVSAPVPGTSDTVSLVGPVGNDGEACAAGATLVVTSWSVTQDGSLRYVMYGRVKRPQDLAVTRMDAVRLTLTTQHQPGIVHVGGGPLPASPLVPSEPQTPVAPEPTRGLLDVIGGVLGG